MSLTYYYNFSKCFPKLNYFEHICCYSSNTLYCRRLMFPNHYFPQCTWWNVSRNVMKPAETGWFEDKMQPEISERANQPSVTEKHKADEEKRETKENFCFVSRRVLGNRRWEGDVNTHFLSSLYFSCSCCLFSHVSMRSHDVPARKNMFFLTKMLPQDCLHECQTMSTAGR